MHGDVTAVDSCRQFQTLFECIKLLFPADSDVGNKNKKRALAATGL